MACSGFATGIYATNSPDACQYVADNAQCNIIVVENNLQLQKIIKVWDQLPDLKAVIQYRDTPVKMPRVFSVSECICNNYKAHCSAANVFFVLVNFMPYVTTKTDLYTCDMKLVFLLFCNCLVFK